MCGGTDEAVTDTHFVKLYVCVYICAPHVATKRTTAGALNPGIQVNLAKMSFSIVPATVLAKRERSGKKATHTQTSPQH